jgi:2',3'-cyclic-nucleotide 2'-phosphodiesterase (5'-nucleotidase family)
MRFALRAPLLVLAACVALAGCKQEKKASRRLQVLVTTDEHSHLFAFSPERDDFPLPTGPGSGALVGGIARRAAVLDAERDAARTRGVDTVTFSVGDFSQGTLATAAFLMTSPDLGALKAMRYDAAMLGNHEFDLGPAALAYSISAAQARDALPPLVLSNAVFDPGAGDDALEALYGDDQPIAPWRMITTLGGLKVGVVGVLGPGAAKVAAGAAPVTFLQDEADPITAIVLKVQPIVNALREVHRADYVIVLSHGGIGRTAPTGDDEKLAALLSGVDLVLSGHSHYAPDAPRMVANVDGREVAVVQPAAYGREVGRVELLLEDGRSRLDPARTAFLAIDDTIAPTGDPKVLGELDGVVDVLESYPLPGVGVSFLAATLAGVTGGPVAHATRGDLYFKTLGHTTFPVVGLAPGETNGMNLDTDAMLATARTLVPGEETVAALQASAAVRADLVPGATGALSFADLYRMAPMGVDPSSATGTPGYPLVRFHVTTVELKDALEASLLQSMLDGDFFIGVSGLRVEYDKTRAPLDPSDPTGPGWIVRLAKVDDSGAETEVLYDATRPAAERWGTTMLSLQPIVTTWQIGAYAAQFGVTPRTATGAATTLAASVVLGPDGTTHLKDHQALAGYVYALCGGGAGNLPSRYDATTPEGAVPRRMVCTGPICP